MMKNKKSVNVTINSKIYYTIFFILKAIGFGKTHLNSKPILTRSLNPIHNIFFMADYNCIINYRANLSIKPIKVLIIPDKGPNLLLTL
jgi:hypothetical protein